MANVVEEQSSQRNIALGSAMFVTELWHAL